MTRSIVSFSLFTAMQNLVPCDAFAETINIVNWNVEQGSVENVIRRKEDFEQAANDATGFGTPDILILQEINSVASAQEIASNMGMANPHVVVSDFGKDSEVIFFGLEVAVASTITVVSVTEYQHEKTTSGSFNAKFADGPFWVKPDRSIELLGDDAIADIEVPEGILPEHSSGAPRNMRVTRGLLRVELENGLIIYPVHFKSNNPAICFEVNRNLSDARRNLRRIKEKIPSYENDIDAALSPLDDLYLKGSVRSLRKQENQQELRGFTESHLDNAVSRENAAAALMWLVAKDLEDGTKTVIVAGDFNTPLIEPGKAGTDLNIECVPTPLDCETKIVPETCEAGTGPDGFDDTHFIMQSESISGASMRPLIDPNIPTYANDGFQLSPIDNIYIAGRLASAELQGVRVGEREHVVDSNGDVVPGKFTVFGSDHFPLQLKLPGAN
ncbi:hypothetical protein [Ruegeria sp. HKCCD7255]|uniref:hypothetical protein n=1 Tax=Ruegeria sp. HKCCD7255 TaxID=2683004 RepID=UPI001C2C2B2C|nr:hypothetical protein [Ruegeria sp. HKCCD7255]